MIATHRRILIEFPSEGTRSGSATPDLLLEEEDLFPDGWRQLADLG